MVACAAAFAWASSVRNRIGQIFTLGATPSSTPHRHIVAALFSESELQDMEQAITDGSSC
ncbi:hypothetical protein GQ55_7G302100 [Panicum hallii var. hallii]|uniref:Uncharacterized protein n=1 Tax=Panicum hallii var. hallii TaxID=1504633 RepID=A0A2T7D0P4_9POAL|nr:hypothetical protein GQ55_7G302100 [Panicum hallii var. hallii]